MMSFELDRNIMKWFDELFENQKMNISFDDFICSVLDIKDQYRLSLNRKRQTYWSIDITLPYKYVRKLRENVHPIFGGYVYEEISIYKDRDIYLKLNMWLQDLYRAILEYSYDDVDNSHIISYRKDFLELCYRLNMGQKLLVVEDIYLEPINQDKVTFTNQDSSITLNLMYSSKLGESMIDSLVDLSKSIIIRR